jgi:hypothetical protein
MSRHFSDIAKLKGRFAASGHFQNYLVGFDIKGADK